MAEPDEQIETAPYSEHRTFNDAQSAVSYLKDLYDQQTEFLISRFNAYVSGDIPSSRVRAWYPEIRIQTKTHAQIDSRLSFGHVSGPGRYQISITRPDLFGSYLEEQIHLLIKNHDAPVSVGLSSEALPLHFAWPQGMHVEGALPDQSQTPLRDIFDVPDLAAVDDSVVNGDPPARPRDAAPLALFSAPRIDYSLQRLAHYTATSADHFQNFVLFTNYQFYIDEFAKLAKEWVKSGHGGYTEFVEPGNLITSKDGTSGEKAARMPQMPAYHLKTGHHAGITLVNIGVGPSNAKTITDHIAVLRPHAWLMLGHCAGLRNTQKLGDYVLAHGYVREDHVLDADLPVWVPIPPLAEVQVAMEQAVAEVTGLQGYDLKAIMRTGTVATIDNRNWELRDEREQIERFSKSRAIGLDMESATIAANGFRFRVPYGTLLCISDKPLHGELKLPGMASGFYREQVNRHLEIGIRAMEKLRDMPIERLHSRKLRSFTETAFQ